jgi:hypothetical protein
VTGGVMRAPIRLECAEGHEVVTQAPPGSQVRCGICANPADGDGRVITLVEVPADIPVVPMPKTEPGMVRTPITAVCHGHRVTNQAAPGQVVECGGCAQAGLVTKVTMQRTDDKLVPEHTLKRRPVSCRTCGRSAARMMPGWCEVTVTTDPARDSRGRTEVRLGPYCSSAHAADAIARPLRTESAPQPPRPDKYDGLADLMAEAPRPR